jgi:hypothetical protein
MIKNRLATFIDALNRSRREKPVLFWLRVAALIAVIVLFAVKRSFWTPDTLFIVLLALFIILGQARVFVMRFLPFIALLLAYDSFRGIADDLNNNVHFYEMIHADEWMFAGHLPTNVLQDWWWNGTLQWYDFFFYFLYTLHFVMPIALAIILWKLRENLYWPFVWALVGLSFAAFITYIVFPAAPPWMASELGYIDPIHKISTDIWFAMGIENPSEVYKNLSPNLVAAVPSLHSAYPLLFAMFLIKAFGWKRMGWILAYPIAMWVGVTYLGEHYVIDAILGAMYAAIAYFVSMWFFKWARARKWHFSEHYKRGHDWGYKVVQTWRRKD